MSGLVLVSTELAPYTPGDYGEIMHGVLRSMSDDDRTRTTLVLVDCAVDRVAFGSMFPGVRLIAIDTSEDRGRSADGRLHPPPFAYSNTPWHWRSAVVFRELALLGKEAPIDYLEFPDRGGLGFCTLQERRLAGFLDQAVIAVRLHMSHTALLHSEAFPVAIADLNLGDLERKCLRDCDRVIAPLSAASDATRRMFGFAPDSWDERVVLHAPPVLFSARSASAEAAPALSDQTIVLAPALERHARPELFVRAVSAFLRMSPQHTGRIRMQLSNEDTSYVARVERLIPPDLRSRFEFTEAGDALERRAAFESASVVVPGEFDSFCVAAYEASARGARLILNERNPAFGDGSPWQDGVNCLKFDGTVDGLTRAFKRNFAENKVLGVVEAPTNPWPWTAERKMRAPWRSPVDEPIASVVVSHHNLGAYVAQTINNVLAQTYRNIEVIVVDDASTDPDSIKAIDMLVKDSDPRVRVVHLSGNVGLAAARNIGIRQAVGKYVLTLDADDLIHPRFIAVGVAALENDPEFDIVVTPAGYFLDGQVTPSMGDPSDFCDYAVFSGEAVVAGLVENRFSTATALFRKAALDQFPYLESLDCYEDWSLYMRMCEAGHRFIVTTDVYFFYRRRQNSMVHAPRDATRRHMEYSDLMRTSAPGALRQKSRYLMIGMGSVIVAPGGDTSTGSRNATGVPTNGMAGFILGGGGQYDTQVVFGALKVSRWLERKAPYIVRGCIFIARRVWRTYRALRS